MDTNAQVLSLIPDVDPDSPYFRARIHCTAEQSPPYASGFEQWVRVLNGHWISVELRRGDEMLGPYLLPVGNCAYLEPLA